MFEFIEFYYNSRIYFEDAYNLLDLIQPGFFIVHYIIRWFNSNDTDFERGFISAEVTKYDDLIALGSESNVKKEGKVRTEGKTYDIVDGDIIYFKFNVSDPGKKKK